MPQISPAEPIQTITAKVTAPSRAPATPSAPIAPTPDVPHETIPETAVPNTEPAKPSEFDEKFASLSRKERQIFKKQKEVAQREQQLSQKYKPFEEISELAHTNKLEALKRLGLSYDDLTNLMLNQNPVTPEQLAEQKASEIAKREVEALKSQILESQKQQQQQQYQQALVQISQEAKAEAEASQEFSLVKKIEGFDTVTALIEQTFHDTGKILPVKEALKEYQNFLEENIVELAKDPSISSRLSVGETPAVQQPAAPSAAIQQPKTLTHKSSVAPTAPKALTAEERRQKAIDVFYGRAT